MAGAPQQLPRFNFPGAQWFSLAPNRSLAIQGRRRATFTTNIVVVPATTILNINENNLPVPAANILETQFSQTSGIYIHKADLFIQNQDATLKLQIVSVALGLRLSSANGTATYLLGTPFLTFATPSNVQQLALSERELLVTERDIEIYSTPPFDGNLHVGFNISLNNADAAAHSTQVAARLIYTRVDGFLE